MKGIASLEQQRRGYARGGKVQPAEQSVAAPGKAPAHAKYKVEHVVKPLKRGGPARGR